eukprot:6172184-Pleurochrysis_carterae.AAC.4
MRRAELSITRRSQRGGQLLRTEISDVRWRMFDTQLQDCAEKRVVFYDAAETVSSQQCCGAALVRKVTRENAFARTSVQQTFTRQSSDLTVQDSAHRVWVRESVVVVQQQQRCPRI